MNSIDGRRLVRGALRIVAGTAAMSLSGSGGAAIGGRPDDECTAIRGVIERMQALLAARAPLHAITDVFGFTRMTSVPATPWLTAHAVASPDGHDAAWAFDLAQVGGTGWITPRLVFADVPIPRLPDDFHAVGIDVAKTWEGWKIVEENGLPRRRDLDKIPGFDAHFPFPEQDFHPNEIAAEVLPHWILQDRPGIAMKKDRNRSRRHVCNVADWF
jgi:hypothetical protein